MSVADFLLMMRNNLAHSNGWNDLPVFMYTDGLGDNTLKCLAPSVSSDTSYAVPRKKLHCRL
jgi:hypothetical protein